jgi:hypothetical protein
MSAKDSRTLIALQKYKTGFICSKFASMQETSSSLMCENTSTTAPTW